MSQALSNTLSRFLQPSCDALEASSQDTKIMAMAVRSVARGHAPRILARQGFSLYSDHVVASQGQHSRPETGEPERSSSCLCAASVVSGHLRVAATRCARRSAFRPRRGGGVPPPLPLQPRRGVTVAHHHELRKSQATEAFASKLVPVLPNPSLNRSANGRPPGPAWRYAVHFRQSGPGVLPLSPG